MNDIVECCPIIIMIIILANDVKLFKCLSRVPLHLIRFHFTLNDIDLPFRPPSPPPTKPITV